MFKVRRLLVVALSTAVMAACSPAPAQSPMTSQRALPVEVATAPTVAPRHATPVSHLDGVANEVPTVPIDPRVRLQHDVMASRSAQAEAAGGLQPATPILSAAEIGAVDAWASEVAEPFMHFSYFRFDSESAMHSANRRWVVQRGLSARLPEGAYFITRMSGTTLSVTYFFPEPGQIQTHEACY